jgi:hypothetical protein
MSCAWYLTVRAVSWPMALLAAKAPNNSRVEKVVFLTVVSP